MRDYVANRAIIFQHWPYEEDLAMLLIFGVKL